MAGLPMFKGGGDIPPNTWKVKILDDGRIVIETGSHTDGKIHTDATRVLADIARLMGGEVTTTPRKGTHGHSHEHGHSHDHDHDGHGHVHT